MSKKFFSLIKDGSFRRAPETKIIPAEEFSTLLEAAEILNLVKNDAETFKIEQLREAETLKAEAEKNGFEKGFERWTEALAQMEKEIAQVRSEMEKIVVSVALKAAKKIVGREIELSKDAVFDIVATTLKSVSQHKKVVIYVNRKDLASLENHRSRLKDLFENLESLSIRERTDIDSGGCIIETEGGIINARLENKWRILEKAFESLLHNKQETAPLTKEEHHE